MITTFEDKTKPLTEGELKILPAILSVLRNLTAPTKSPEVCEKIRQVTGKKISGVTLRKYSNFIRVNNSLMNLALIATQQGYFVTSDEKIIQDQIKSLNERAASIRACANGLSKLIEKPATQGRLF